MMETQDNTGAEQGDQTGVATVDMPVEQLIDYVRAGGAGPVDAGPIVAHLDAVIAAQDDLHARSSEAQSKADDAQAEIAELKDQLAKAQAETAKAHAKAAKLSAGEKAARPRKIGAIDKAMDRADLVEAISKAEKVEILFGNGKQEVGAAPIVVEGDVWRDHPLGLMLGEPVTIDGPAHGSQPYHITGAALLLDGKQVAWSERPEPISVGAGMKYQLSNDIFF